MSRLVVVALVVVVVVVVVIVVVVVVVVVFCFSNFSRSFQKKITKQSHQRCIFHSVSK